MAIKWLTPGAADPAHEGSELAILAGLDHHNLITLLDAGIHRMRRDAASGTS